MHKIHVHVPYDRIREHAGLIRQGKFDLEVLLKAETLDSVSPDEISGLYDFLGYKPSLSIHGPFMDLSPGALDSKIRDATIKRFHQALDIAEKLKPAVIVFHSGYEKWKYDHRADLWLQGCMKTWPDLIKRAESIGTKIAIENIFEEEPDNLVMLMERLVSPNFGICFDTGHFNLFSKKPLSEWLETIGPHIMELHLHDNKGDIDAHDAIGEGGFDFKALFEALKGKELIYTIEGHTPEAVILSLKRLDGILNNT